MFKRGQRPKEALHIGKIEKIKQRLSTLLDSYIGLPNSDTIRICILEEIKANFSMEATDNTTQELADKGILEITIPIPQNNKKEIINISIKL